MFFQLLFIHLYRPFLKYTKETSPLPAHVSPRRLCTQAASMISKLLRMYKRSYGLRQLCNVTVYIVHSACTIHLLNLPDKGAKRDIVHGLKNLEEIGEGWLCARRTIQILDLSAQKWGIDLPDEASAVLERCRVKFGTWGSSRPTQSPPAAEESPSATGHAHASPSTHCSTPESSAYPDIPRGVTGTDLGNMMAQCASSPSSAMPPPPPPPTGTQGGVQNPRFSLQSACPNSQFGPKVEGDLDLPRSYAATSTQNQSTTPMIPQLPALSGVEHLLLGSQDWWMKDQSALALGLDNWDGSWDTPSRDVASSMSFDLAMPSTTAPNPSFANTPQMTQPSDQYPAASMNMNVDMPITQSGYGSNYIMASSNPPIANPIQEISHTPQRNGYGQNNGNNLYY